MHITLHSAPMAAIKTEPVDSRPYSRNSRGPSRRDPPKGRPPPRRQHPPNEKTRHHRSSRGQRSRSVSPLRKRHSPRNLTTRRVPPSGTHSTRPLSSKTTSRRSPARERRRPPSTETQHYHVDFRNRSPPRKRHIGGQIGSRSPLRQPPPCETLQNRTPLRRNRVKTEKLEHSRATSK